MPAPAYIRRILYRLGHDPRRSLKVFLLGFAIFMLGVALIAAGYYTWHLLQVPGLVLLLLGALVAGRGYLGLLANRLGWFFER